MKFLYISVIFLILFISSTLAYNSIYEFDENEDIIIITTVYNSTGLPCYNCKCNITLYNPNPNENIINSSYNMQNIGNGLYKTPELNLSYNVNIYPMVLYCNDSENYFGGDTRNGIKVSETAFDYTSIIIAMLGIAIGFLIVSFTTNKEFDMIRKISFFSSFGFLFLTLASAFVIMLKSPNNGSFMILFTIAIIVFLAIIGIIIYFYALKIIENSFDKMDNG